jgi:ABC-type lipoprotein export system ATPase subunit
MLFSLPVRPFLMICAKMISLQNFRCHNNTTFRFDIGKLNLISGESGVGKTTILEAISWCLYLRPNTGFRGSDSSATIVTLKVGNIHVSRRSSPRTLMIKVGNTKYKNNEAKEKIVEIFGTYESWTTSSYIRQGEVNSFLNATSHDRAKIAREIVFGKTDVDSIREGLRDELKRAKKVRDDLIIRIEALTESLPSRPTKIITPPNEIDQQIHQLESRLEHCKQNDNNHRELTRLKKELPTISSSNLDLALAMRKWKLQQQLPEKPIRLDIPDVDVKTFVQQWNDYNRYQKIQPIDGDWNILSGTIPQLSVDEITHILNRRTELSALIMNQPERSSYSHAELENIQSYFVSKSTISHLSKNAYKQCRAKLRQDKLCAEINIHTLQDVINALEQWREYDEQMELAKLTKNYPTRVELEKFLQVQSSQQLQCPQCCARLLLCDDELVHDRGAENARQMINNLDKIRDISVPSWDKKTLIMLRDNWIDSAPLDYWNDLCIVEKFRRYDQVDIVKEMDKLNKWEEWSRTCGNARLELDKLPNVTKSDLRIRQVYENLGCPTNKQIQDQIWRSQIQCIKPKMTIEEYTSAHNYLRIAKDMPDIVLPDDFDPNMYRHYHEINRKICQLENIVTNDKTFEEVQCEIRQLMEEKIGAEKWRAYIVIYRRLRKAKEDLTSAENTLFAAEQLYDAFDKLVVDSMATFFRTVQKETQDIVTHLFRQNIIFEIGVGKKRNVDIGITIGDHSHSSWKSLSGGEKSRISFALILAISRVKKSPLLMFDETFSNLDTEKQDIILSQLATVTSTTLIISHTINESHVDNVLIINNKT